MSVIPALRRQKQEDGKFQASLGCIVRLCVKKKKKKKEKERKKRNPPYPGIILGLLSQHPSGKLSQ
jgi:hypothetical protein